MWEYLHSVKSYSPFTRNLFVHVIDFVLGGGGTKSYLALTAGSLAPPLVHSSDGHKLVAPVTWDPWAEDAPMRSPRMLVVLGEALRCPCRPFYPGLFGPFPVPTYWLLTRVGCFGVGMSVTPDSTHTHTHPRCCSCSESAPLGGAATKGEGGRKEDRKTGTFCDTQPAFVSRGESRRAPSPGPRAGARPQGVADRRGPSRRSASERRGSYPGFAAPERPRAALGWDS